MSNYPPGCSGLEYEIAGPDSEQEGVERDCPTCETPQLGTMLGYRHEFWWVCDNCGEVDDIPYDEIEL